MLETKSFLGVFCLNVETDKRVIAIKVTATILFIRRGCKQSEKIPNHEVHRAVYVSCLVDEAARIYCSGTKSLAGRSYSNWNALRSDWLIAL